MNNRVAFLLLAIGALTVGTASALDTHTGICDASAVAVLDAGQFIVASDEENDLYIYDIETKSAKSVVELDDFLEHPNSEADLEGVTRIGDTLIWIGSHGRKKSTGEFLEERHVLFATGLSGEPKGTPYRELAQDLSNHQALAELDLGRAIEFDDKGRIFKLSPKRSGLNIEGLATTEGLKIEGMPKKGLLIGLRNPLSTDKRAILIPMTNPMDVLLTKDGQPEFAKPILLDLGGRGIRSIEYVSETQSGRKAAYYILAGPKGTGKVFLYRWSGKTSEDPGEVEGFGEHVAGFCKKCSAEGLALGPKGKQLFIVIDNGKEKIDGKECKDLDQAKDKRFYMKKVPLDGS